MGSWRLESIALSRQGFIVEIDSHVLVINACMHASETKIIAILVKYLLCDYILVMLQ